MEDSKLLSRKFILALLAEIGLFVLLALGKIDFDQFATLFSAVVLGYGVLNVIQKGITK
jgi:hypothetical protein